MAQTEKCTFNSLSNELADIISITLLSHMLNCGMEAALNLFSIESNNPALDSTCFKAALAITHSIGGLYIYCKISENITNDLYSIGDAFYECVWYRLPIKQQKTYSMPIQCGQKEFRLMGLGFIECSLETYFAVWTHFWMNLHFGYISLSLLYVFIADN